MIYARQSTAIIVTIGPILDANGVAVTDGVVADLKISKNGAAPAALNGSATLTHRHTGHYSLALTATDVNTVGTVEVVIDDTVNACPVKEIQVVEEAIYDSMFAAGAVELATTQDITDLAATLSTVEDIGIGVWATVRSGNQTVGTFGEYIDAAISTAGGGASAAAIADAVWDEARAGHVAAGSFGEYTNALLVDSPLHGGTSMVLTFERMRGISTTTNQPCIHIDGNGDGAGMEIHGGATGPGLYCWTPATGLTTGWGIYATGPAGGMWTEATGANGRGWYASGLVADGFGIYSLGNAAGISGQGGSTGFGVFAVGVGSAGIHSQGTIGMNLTGDTGSGLRATSTAAAGHGVHLDGGASGDDIFLAGSDAPTLSAAVLAAGSITSTVAPNLDAAISTRATPAQVQTELGTYDAPTKAEMDAALALLATSAQLVKVLAAVYDTATVAGSVITLSNGATQTITAGGRTTA